VIFMKAISAKINGGLDIGAIVQCDDNTGVKKIRVIAKIGYRGRRRRRPAISVGDIFSGSVVVGKKGMKKKIVRAVLVRQRKPYKRANGDVIQFEDNAAILITDKKEAQGSEIKGAVAKEVGERFPRIPTVAKNVV